MNTTLKLTIAIVAPLMVFSCSSRNSKNTKNLKEKVENFDWLLGSWKRINEEAGKETFEVWEKFNETQYEGIGFTMQHGDTIQRENIQILKHDGKWNLMVKTSKKTKAIAFPISTIKDNEFVCTNDSLDFPKKIKYWKDEENLKALVAGDSLKIDFEFERIEE